MRRLIYILTGSLILVLSGCTKYEIPVPECPDGTTGISFSSGIQPIFDNNCLICHAGGQSPDLSPGWSYDELMDGEFINADFPCSSRIYEVFSGTHDGRVTEEERLDILGWIQEGAENN